MRSARFDDREVTPSKLVCIGRNYVAHIEELGNEIPEDMVVFLKPNSALSPVLRATREGEALHYEGEIAFLIERGRLAGVGFALDLTRRELQARLKRQGLPWERAKAFDGAALCSDFVPLNCQLDDLSLELRVDDELRQRGGVNLMLYHPRVILETVAGFMHLEDGDILLTGTPAGVGPVLPGQRFHGSIRAGGRELVSASWVAQA